MPSAAKKSRVTPHPLSTPESGPGGRLFPAVDNAAIVNWPPQLHTRGPNIGFLILERDPAFLLSVVSIIGYHKPPSMSTHLSPRRSTPPPILGLQLMVSHGVDKRNALAIVVQCPSDFLNITVLFHQFHRINLTETVRGHILRESERLSGPLDIFPNSLPGMMFMRIPAGENPIFPRMISKVR